MSDGNRRRSFSANNYIQKEGNAAASTSNIRSSLMQRRTERASADSATDLSTVLNAIHELKRDMMRGLLRQRTASEETLSADEAMAQDVRVEIAQMVRTIAKAKSEISQIKNPNAQERDHIETASGELDEIVAATEDATNRILEANESIQGLLDEIGALHPDDEDLQVKVDSAGAQIVNVLEACNFQDITGQRITKVVNTLRFIEDRILAMISIWGAEAFTDLPVGPGGADAEGGWDDDDLLHGPQRENEGISQDEIDALFD